MHICTQMVDLDSYVHAFYPVYMCLTESEQLVVFRSLCYMDK